MKRVLVGLFFALLLGSGNITIAQEETDLSDKKSAAVIAAHNWLAYIDQGNYSESWEQAAAFFKNSISSENWGIAVSAVRVPLGSVMSREVQTTSYHTSLPGAPDGEYVVITFLTSFANKDQAIETITPTLDQDGQWRVSGYFIK